MPLRRGDQTCRPMVPTHQWSGATVRRAGCQCVHPPVGGDEGRGSDPPIEFKGVGSEVERGLSISVN
ncbi:hypothetical protein TNCV_5105331 [Trichonephila clavipes]|nr:hypothetical protein TNCV_5105331 [Trichonephila clavipes]